MCGRSPVVEGTARAEDDADAAAAEDDDDDDEDDDDVACSCGRCCSILSCPRSLPANVEEEDLLRSSSNDGRRG